MDDPRDGWKQTGDTSEQDEMNLGRADNFKDVMVRGAYPLSFLSTLRRKKDGTDDLSPQHSLGIMAVMHRCDFFFYWC